MCRRRTLAGSAVAASMALGLVGLAGCSGSSGGTTAASDSAGLAGGRSNAAAAGTASRAALPEPAALTSRAEIVEGSMDLVSRDLAMTRTRVDDLLHSVGGYVADESTERTTTGRIRTSTLMLRIPVHAFARTVSALQGFGDARSTHTSSEDVTTQVIDVHSRLQTARESLRRLHTIIARATSVRDLLAFEHAISAREATVQSLQQRSDYLRNQTTLATLTLTLETRSKPTPPPPSWLQKAGFVTGLSHGWSALRGAGIVLLTTLGAVLPAAVLVALLGLPAALVVRRRRRKPTATPDPAG